MIRMDLEALMPVIDMPRADRDHLIAIVKLLNTLLAPNRRRIILALNRIFN